jgi:hypothetical protein
MKKVFGFLALIAVILVTVFLGHEAGAGTSVAIAGVGGLMRTPKGLTVEQLENYANGQLSSFAGENENFEDYEEFEGYDEFEGFDDYEDYEDYVGYNDDFVDFGGFNTSFANAGDSGRLFVMTITNTDVAAAHSCYIAPGLLYTPGGNINGVVKDGAFNDVNGAAGLTGAGSPKSIDTFFAFLQHNPIHIMGFKVEGSIAAQVAQIVVVTEQSPFKDLQSKPINLGSYQNENTFRDKIVTVPTKNLILSNQVQMLIPIPAGCTTTITLLVGGILNTSYALQQKGHRAASTIARVGVNKVNAAHAGKHRRRRHLKQH